jgi:protein-S-isoprenylcysteine O-methyltransferase Ste14
MPGLLIYTWPYAPLFWIVFIWAFAPEFRVISGRGEPATTPLDAGSKPLLVFGQGLANLAAFFAASLVPWATLGHGLWFFWIGLCAIVGGSLLRRHCYRMLGQSFTGAVIVKPGQEVVERGAYRYVRHPSYTGGAIMFAGIGLALDNWISLALVLVSVLIVYGYRVGVEERALVAVIGDPYRQYMSRTKRFVPFLF